MSVQLHFVCGKGGVGKSTFSCALAKHFVAQGERVLLAQVNAKDSHSELLGCTAIESEPAECSERLWGVNVTPEASLHEYIMLKVRSERVFRLVFDNSLMRSFLKFTPSLAELNMLGKIWFHAEQKRADGDPLYTRVIIDCPATGHGYRFLRVAQVTYEGVRLGAIANEALAMADTLRDPKRSCVHLVSLPAEMPVSEAIQLAGQIQESKVVPLGLLVLNDVTPKLFDPKTRKQVEAFEPEANPWVRAGLHRCMLEAEEEAQCARLQAALPNQRCVVLPHTDGPLPDLNVLVGVLKRVGL